jgi:hypothetical protein
MSMSSVKELEEQNARERKILMQALSKYLKQSDIEAELKEETASNYLGMTFQESVIQIKGKNLDTIRLVGIDSGGCGVPGNVMRFQYGVRLNKEISTDLIEKIKCETKLIKEGKIIGYFGGKVVEVKWVGKELAEVLNKDSEISVDMLKCTKSWSYLEYSIETNSGEIDILGPRFVDPQRIVQLYETEIKREVECCLFGFQTVEKIAKHIKEFVSANS